MPMMHELIHKANWMFDPGRIAEVPLEMLDALGLEATFADAVHALELTNRPSELAYINAWPRGQLRAVAAAVRSCLSRSPRMPITFAWVPAYDYQITIWESAGVRESMRGEMTILFGSRDPGDENPVRLAEPES